MELLRLSTLYIHLIACCVAIGLIFTSDFAMIKQLLGKHPDAPQDPRHLHHLKDTISYALVALWVSGIAIIWIDASAKGLVYFLNPKLQAKIAIVMLLTLNGFFLHSMVLPALEKAGSLLNMSLPNRVLANFIGTVSGVSWFYAAFIGVGRPLAWKYTLPQLLAAYPVLIACGFTLMMVLTLKDKDLPVRARRRQGNLDRPSLMLTLTSRIRRAEA